MQPFRKMATYSLQFGTLESRKFGAARWSCIEAAIEQLRRRRLS